MKLCNKCSLKKLFPDFYKSKYTKDGFRSVCKDCDDQRKLDYAKKNVESIAKQKKEYQIKNKEKTLLYASSWRKKYKHKMCVYASKRRALLLNATPSWADNKKIELIYKEVEMLNKLNPEIKYEVDHIIPLKNNLVCGLHTHDNIQILLATENRSKKNLFFINGVQ